MEYENEYPKEIDEIKNNENKLFLHLVFRLVEVLVQPFRIKLNIYFNKI